jgi:putative transposase
MKALREEARLKAGRNKEPSVALIDLRSFKSAQKRGPRGYDAGQKTQGRKPHIAVDTMGFLLTVVVHSAGIQDRVGARAVLIRLLGRIPGIRKVFADGGYTGKLIAWTAAMFAATMEIVKRSDSGKFIVLPNP